MEEIRNPGEVATSLLGCEPVTWAASGHLWWKKPERVVCMRHGHSYYWPCPWWDRARVLIIARDAEVVAAMTRDQAKRDVQESLSSTLDDEYVEEDEYR